MVVAVLEMSLFVRFARGRGREETQRDGGGMTLRVLVLVRVL